VIVFKIEYRDEAHLDLYEARGYCARRTPDLLAKFDNVIMEAIDRLKKVLKILKNDIEI
jgi:hypothetical protein